MWQGTSDLTGWLAVPTALKLLNSIGLERVIAHNSRMVQKAADLLLERWGRQRHGSVIGGEASCSSDGSCNILTTGKKYSLEGIE